MFERKSILNGEIETLNPKISILELQLLNESFQRRKDYIHLIDEVIYLLILFSI